MKIKLLKNDQEFCDVTDLNMGQAHRSADIYSVHKPDIMQEFLVTFLATKEPSPSNATEWAICRSDGSYPIVIHHDGVTKDADMFRVVASRYI